MTIKIAPSLLAANFSYLHDQIKMIETAGADRLHLDIMDGHFVPNISFGPLIISAIRPSSNLFFETHLMISDPEKYLEEFIQAGSNSIIFHAEAISNPRELITKIHSHKISAGVSIKPGTPLDLILPYADCLDCVLFMTVEPGFGGQAFMPNVLPKIKDFHTHAIQNKLRIDIEVDGGVTLQTAPQAVSAGANVLIAGTSVFKHPNPSEIISQLQNLG